MKHSFLRPCRAAASSLVIAAAALAAAADPPAGAADAWVSRIPLDGGGPRYESASGLPRRYRLGTLPDGGTYSGVARLFFGTASAWPAILEANRDRFPDPARLPPSADLVLPAPATALPPAAPGLSASIALVSVERRPRDGIAEDTDPDFREKTQLRFRLCLSNETDRTIEVSFYKEFKTAHYSDEPSFWFPGECTFEDPKTGENACNEWRAEKWSYRIGPRGTRETWLEIGCIPSLVGPEMSLRFCCLLDDAERPTSGPDDSRVLYWRGVVPAATPWAAAPSAPPPAADPAPAAARSNACDRLSLAILADAAAARRNIVFSPFSLSGALGMAALGAKGETLAQIDRVAGTGADPEALANREARARAAILKAARADGIELVLADSLWKRKGDAPLPGFAERVRRGFGGEVLDFGPFPASAVNRWGSGSGCRSSCRARA